MDSVSQHQGGMFPMKTRRFVRPAAVESSFGGVQHGPVGFSQAQDLLQGEAKLVMRCCWLLPQDFLTTAQMMSNLQGKKGRDS